MSKFDLGSPSSSLFHASLIRPPSPEVCSNCLLFINTQLNWAGTIAARYTITVPVTDSHLIVIFTLSVTENTYFVHLWPYCAENLIDSNHKSPWLLLIDCKMAKRRLSKKEFANLVSYSAHIPGRWCRLFVNWPEAPLISEMR